MIIHKINPSVDYNQWLKHLDTQLKEPTNKYSIKVPKEVEWGGREMVSEFHFLSKNRKKRLYLSGKYFFSIDKNLIKEILKKSLKPALVDHNQSFL